MTKKLDDNPEFKTMLDEIVQSLAEGSPSSDELRHVGLRMSDFVDLADEASRSDLVRGGEMVARILGLAIEWKSQFADDPQLVDEMVKFLVESTSAIKQSLTGSEPANAIDDLIASANDRWGEYLFLVDEELQSDPWEMATEGEIDGGDKTPDDDNVADSNSQIELMLSALSAAPESAESDDMNLDGMTKRKSTSEPTPIAKSNPDDSDDRPRPSSSFDIEDDRELLEAYLDDALRCVAVMEQAALAIEASPSDRESIQQFCRELHTLKGASATVGLSDLASFLHTLETSLESVFAGETTNVDTDLIFESIDRVRTIIAGLQTPTTQSQSQSESDDGSVAPQTGASSLASCDDSSVRIRVEKLDRLMDMLAELVVLRNRRENHVAEFNNFNSELGRCASRLDLADEYSEFGSAEIVVPASNTGNLSHTLAEVSKDISAVSRGMRELQKPVIKDNDSISLFIRDFRQELMLLRRVPVSGLFLRLQRAVRDVAKTEDKKVQVHVVGENAGLEQEIQERLFESLIHVVRNSVSHGIETPDVRQAHGKEATGNLTLEAFSTAQLLTIEVRDDGNGLDFDAIRNRAVSKGLLAAHQWPSEDELARLIFHPGFSTREQASEVSGRGVGMDIVAKTIDQLQGRVEVDSVAGQGTTIRFLIPLRTGIEHVMVFRSDGQLFALPMQAVTAAKSTNSSIGELARLSFTSTPSFGSHPTNPRRRGQDVLLLNKSNPTQDRSSSRRASSQLALAVDELIGPEEVVVRGLPNLLKNHPLFCGVTLSGSGEKVLLLDSDRIGEFCKQGPDASEQKSRSDASEMSQQTKRVLIVDDSMTVRKALVKILQGQDYSTTEAGDGMEAIERLHREKFDLVLTDLDMPRLGGLELLSDIQAGGYCDAPVVVVSSRDEETFRMKALDAGACDFITKPVDQAAIGQLLERVRERSKNENQGEAIKESNKTETVKVRESNE